MATPTSDTGAAKNFTADELSAFLEAKGFTTAKVVKVLVLGNSGAGKSFLCNALVGANVFEHKTQAKSVTGENSFVPVVFGDRAYVICNVPGLIESNPANIERNKAAIEAAFQLLPGAKTLLLFVVSGSTGGRIRLEDFQAINAVQRYVPLDPAASTVVVNCVDWDEIGRSGDPTEYRIDVAAQVRVVVDPAMTCAFTPKLTRDARDDYDSGAMKDLTMQLVSAMLGLRPAAMEPAAGAKLLLDAEVLKSEAEDLKARLAAQAAEHQREKEEHQEQWRETVRAAADREAARSAALRKLKEEISRYKWLVGGACAVAFLLAPGALLACGSMAAAEATALAQTVAEFLGQIPPPVF